MAAYPRLSAHLRSGAPGRGAGGARAGDARASSTPLVLLHGFTQTGQAWGPVVDALASLGSPWPIVLPDAPGHGGSAGVEADLWETADLLADLVPDAAFWSGYSMGGRAALHVALAYPQLVERLVLISTSAGIEDTAEREARAAADEALARQLEDVGVGPFLEDWLAQPLFATMTSAQAALDQRRANTAAGLASSLRRAGAGAQAPLWDRLAELARRSLPVLVIAGELDARYRGHAERMVAAIGPTASLVVIEGAGHACPLERPAAVASALARFLSD